jgi:hypothetical protein
LPPEVSGGGWSVQGVPVQVGRGNSRIGRTSTDPQRAPGIRAAI